jgi:predicted AAA+ superfamily ATPase
MDTLVLQTIQADNPWLSDPATFPTSALHRIPDPFIHRLVPGVDDWPVLNKAHVVIGARQVGKSSLLWHWFKERELAPLYINAEEPSVRNWCRSPALLLRDISGLADPGTPVFIDEAQHLDEAGLLVKGLVDGGLSNPLFVTGSSAFHLRARTRESLAGRAVRTSLHPFSLRELSTPFLELPQLIRSEKIRETAYRQMQIGGYPEIWLGEEPEKALARLVEAFVIRDASDLFHIRHLDAFRQLMRLVAGQVSSLVNASEWASICGISRGTVMEYLSLLEQTQIIHPVHPFAGGKRAEVVHRPKLYFCDNGMLNIITRQLVPFGELANRGPCLENWVAGEIRKWLSPLIPIDQIRYWRSKSGAEMDFVIERPEGLVAIEVKASEMKRPRLSRSARSFMEAYSPSRLIVVNLGMTHEQEEKETRIQWVRPEAFAEQNPLGLLT